MNREMNREEETKFYESEEAQEPAGPPVRRTAPTLTEHVPIRFSPQAIAAIRRLASREGITVSNWIRRAVEKEIVIFAPTVTESRGVPFKIVAHQDPEQTQSTGYLPGDLERVG